MVEMQNIKRPCCLQSETDTEPARFRFAAMLFRELMLTLSSKPISSTMEFTYISNMRMRILPMEP
jgi:hypothetical protein